jgi:hypothetical protein
MEATYRNDEAKVFRTITQNYYLFKSQHLIANIKLTDRISNDLCLPRLEISGRHLTHKIAAHCWKFSKVHNASLFAHIFQSSYVYDYITKLYRKQVKVVQNHDNEHVRTIGQGEVRHRKYEA